MKDANCFHVYYVAELFNCSAVTGSCASCIAFRSSHSGCGWCSGTSKCSEQTSCSTTVSTIADCGQGLIISVCVVDVF